jgi:hypothetical protein
VELITEPGTISDLVADASAAGYQITQRLVRDWTERGLLDYPHKRPAGKGHGSAPALYPANQRNLLLTLLHHRPGLHIRSLARIPVSIWMYWGEEYVQISQARRALMTWLGDARAGQQQARAAAQTVLSQIDNPRATPAARGELLDVLTEAFWTARPDFTRLERAARAVFEPGSTHIRRAIGHPAAPLMTDSLVNALESRVTAANVLMDQRVSDDALIQARETHLFAYAEYATQQPAYAAAAPPGMPDFYEAVTAENTINNCCGHLLSAIGLEIMFPEEASRIRNARAFRRRPTRAMIGLVSQTNSC